MSSNEKGSPKCDKILKLDISNYIEENAPQEVSPILSLKNGFNKNNNIELNNKNEIIFNHSS